MTTLREQIAERLATKTWDDGRPYSAHSQHHFHYLCEICRGDVNAIADAVMAVVQPALDAKEGTTT